jgi:hypothetical protein
MAADPISVAGPAFIVGLIFFRTRCGDQAALVGTTSVAGFRLAAPPTALSFPATAGIKKGRICATRR